MDELAGNGRGGMKAAFLLGKGKVAI